MRVSRSSYEMRLPRHVASLARSHAPQPYRAAGDIYRPCGARWRPALLRATKREPSSPAEAGSLLPAAPDSCQPGGLPFPLLLQPSQDSPTSAAPAPVRSHSVPRLSLFAPTPPGQRGPAHTAHASLERAQPTASPGQERTNASSARPLPHRKKQRRPHSGRPRHARGPACRPHHGPWGRPGAPGQASGDVLELEAAAWGERGRGSAAKLRGGCPPPSPLPFSHLPPLAPGLPADRGDCKKCETITKSLNIF